ncbi:hypothetical protein KAU33_03850 [Candidatus Dependentiae bacterium]|nr:hypothetical protein [Candidatus Dependentiae bacterium]
MESHEFLVTYRDYEIVNYNTVIFRLFGRDVLGNRIVHHISGAKPYFYIPMGTPIVPDPRVVSIVPSTIPSLLKKDLQKIFVTKPSDVAGRNENITYVKDLYKETYEADILFENRVAIDHNLNGILSCPKKLFLNIEDFTPSENTAIIETRKFIFDIENCDDGTIQDAKDGKKEIYVITIFDSMTNTYHIFSSYSHTSLEEAEIKAIIEKHWKENPYFPNYAHSILEFHYFDDEPEMLEGVIQFFEMNPPDILAGYNSNGYDIPAFCKRCEKLKIEFTRISEVRKVYPNRPLIGGVACMDIQILYRQYQQSTVRYPSLNYVSGVELETAKLPRASILELYQRDRVTLTAYNIIDVQLTVAINEKHSLIDYFNELSITSHASFEEQSRSNLIDNLLLREVSGEMVLPTRNPKIDIATGGKQIRGGIVYQSTPGLHDNVIVLDFAGMYPSIVIALNISPDTKDPNGDVVAANGIRFNSKPIGVIPRILKKLKVKRKVYKKLKAEAESKALEEEITLGKATALTTSLIKQYDLKQYAIKVLMNAFYGVMGYERFRLADAEMGDAITSTGQKLSTSCKLYVENTSVMFKGEKIKIQVIYGDTDSLFIKVLGDYSPEDLKEIAGMMTKGVNDEINRLMKELFNVTEHDVEIEEDKIFKTLFQVPAKTGAGAKKRYAGIIYKFNEEGKHVGEKEVVKGFQMVKADSTKLTKDVQQHLIFDLILKGATKEEVREYLLNIKKDFDEDRISNQDLSIRAPLHKEIKEYGNLQQIIGMKNAKEYLKRDIQVGYVGAFYKLSQSPYKYPAHDVIVLDFDENLPDGYKIDKKWTWERAMYKPIVTILDAYGLSWDYIKTGRMNKELSKIFKFSTKGKEKTPAEIKENDEFYEKIEYEEACPEPEPVKVKTVPKKVPAIITVEGVEYKLKDAYASNADATEYEIELTNNSVKFKILKINDLTVFYEKPEPLGALSKYMKIK